MMMIGYPAQDVDAMVETASAKEWEKNQPQNADGDCKNRAARSLEFAITDLDAVCDLINEAVEILLDTVEGDKVSSLLDDGERLLKELKQIKKQFRGVKE